jgi:photosystem II stability/assembly factor-like uncharacterized protein
MKNKYLLILLLGIVSFTYAQQDQNVDEQISTEAYLENLFYSGRTFTEITTRADAYFLELNPNLTLKELAEGEHRDGDYVKYERWKSFWKNYLMPDGTLGDFTALRREQIGRGLRGANCLDFDYPVEWENISHEDGLGWGADLGKVTCMAFHPTDPDTYYVGAAWGGLWITVNGGETYSILNDDLPLAAIASIVTDPDNPDRIAVALGELHWYNPSSIGIYVSIDGGENFLPTDIAWSPDEENRIFYMDQDPMDGAHVLISSTEGLMETTDFFESFTTIFGEQTRSVKFSRTLPGTIFAGGASGQFYKSEDSGESFSLETDMGAGWVRIAVPLENVFGTNRVVASCGSELYVSEDNGESFEDYDLPDFENNVKLEFAEGDHLLHLGYFSIYKFDLQYPEATFTPITDGYFHGDKPYCHVDQTNAFVNPLVPGSVYFCNDGGIVRADSDGDVINNLSDGLVITQFYDIAVSQSDELGLAGGSQDNGSFYRLSDGDWVHGLGGDGMGQEIDPENSGIRYSSTQNGGLHRWIEGLVNNIKPLMETESGAWETPFRLDPNNPERILVAYDSVYASNDRGNTWEVVGGSIGEGNLNEMAIAPSNSERVYVTRENKLFVKTEDFDEWVERSTPINQWITDIEVDEFDEDIVYICFGGYSWAGGLYGGYDEGDKVYKSTDGGGTWMNISGDLPNLPVMSLELYRGASDRIFIGMHGAVYYTDDPGGVTWRKYGCLPNTGITDIEIQYNTSSIFVGTHGRGIFKSDIRLEDLASVDETTGQQFNLYPNPTTGCLIIASNEFDVTASQWQIFDLAGRVMSVDFVSLGNGQIELDGGQLAEGIYILTILTSSGDYLSSGFVIVR